mmetsp:Transcript_31252/g.99670  ORF Transcript_31252/g.99670 Transcript_31252/m.99670 type:complete len:389 (-) Transcript_31252:69-1235(-)
MSSSLTGSHFRDDTSPSADKYPPPGVVKAADGIPARGPPPATKPRTMRSCRWSSWAAVEWRQTHLTDSSSPRGVSSSSARPFDWYSRRPGRRRDSPPKALPTPTASASSTVDTPGCSLRCSFEYLPRLSRGISPSMRQQRLKNFWDFSVADSHPKGPRRLLSTVTSAVEMAAVLEVSTEASPAPAAKSRRLLCAASTSQPTSATPASAAALRNFSSSSASMAQRVKSTYITVWYFSIRPGSSRRPDMSTRSLVCRAPGLAQVQFVLFVNAVRFLSGSLPGATCHTCWTCSESVLKAPSTVSTNSSGSYSSSTIRLRRNCPMAWSSRAATTLSRSSLSWLSAAAALLRKVCGCPSPAFSRHELMRCTTRVLRRRTTFRRYWNMASRRGG